MELFSYILSQLVLVGVLILKVDFVSCYIAEAAYGV
jgi:hypothetical protein